MQNCSLWFSLLLNFFTSMYKNQLQELAQRSCFNLPSYTCVREGPDHAPRFKATVNFNGEAFEGPSYCSTLRQAENSAAEVALNVLSTGGPSRSLATRVLDETGVCKNLLQETAHRAGLNLPVYTSERSGPGHLPVFTCTVELAGMNFTGDPAKTKKQAEKNAAMAAWSSLKQFPNVSSHMNKEIDNNEGQEVVVAQMLSKFRHINGNRSSREMDRQPFKRRAILCPVERSGGSSLKPDATPFQSIEPKILYNCTLPLSTTCSKIRPPMSMASPKEPSSTKDNTCIYSTKMPLIPVQDEEEWLSRKSKAKRVVLIEETNNANTSSISRPSSSCHKPHSISINPRISVQNQFKNRFLRHEAASAGGLCSERVAPPVQIRSMIPVCAAPPARLQRNTQNNIVMHKKEAQASDFGFSLVSTQLEQQILALKRFYL